MRIFEPHTHMSSRVTVDYERMAQAGMTDEPPDPVDVRPLGPRAVMTRPNGHAHQRQQAGTRR